MTHVFHAGAMRARGQREPRNPWWILRWRAKIVWPRCPGTWWRRTGAYENMEPLRSTVLKMPDEGRASGVFKAHIRVRQLQNTGTPHMRRPGVVPDREIADFGVEG